MTKYKIIEGPCSVQGSPEWLAYRSTRITASDVPSILNVGFKTPIQVMQEKRGILENKSNSAMKRGSAMEPIARAAFEEATGIKVIPVVAESLEYPWLAASLDGLSLCGKYAVEIKCPGKEDHAHALKGLIPPKYLPQLHAQMLVLGLEKIFYYSFDGTDGVLVEWEYNQEYIDWMLPILQEFYRKLCDFEDPELTDKDYEIRNDERLTYLTDQWKEAHRDFCIAETRVKQLRNAVIDESGNKNTKCNGVRVRFGRRAGNIDFKAIKELEGVDLEPYRKKDIEVRQVELDG